MAEDAVTRTSVVEFLERLLETRDPTERTALIGQFESALREATEWTGDAGADDAIANLIADLAYYEPRKAWREDRSLFGDDELDRRAAVYLSQLGARQSGREESTCDQ